ncbi:MAG: lauroyl acyltransferase [Alphaproteobacteria bacterium]|nr:lauroyl acyltransferase [Alphaproteobacteria bacterium]
MKTPLSPVLYPLEALGALVAYGAMHALPLETASAFGAAVLARIGPRLALHARARDNLARAFPGMADAEIDTILDGMWRNLGQTAGEFAHLKTMRAEIGERVEVIGAERAEALAASPGPTIFISGHLANWELMPLVSARFGMPIDAVFRAPDNPLVRSLYNRRRIHPDSRMIPKGGDGARMVLTSLREKRRLGLLVDQKLNEGIEARFFGRPAMTGDAFAQFAIRLKCPVVPIRIERLEGVRFRVTVEAPMAVPDTGDRTADVTTMVQAANDLLEGWIRERPEQWLWVHKRWKA